MASSSPTSTTASLSLSNGGSSSSLMKVWIREYNEDPTQAKEQENAEQSSVQPIRSFVATSATTKSTQKLVLQERHTARRMMQSLWKSPEAALRNTFLPIGYPHSVAPGYAHYQGYDSLQGLCSYLRGVLCQAAVLKAAGVGNAEAVALSAAMTWAMKDGMAMFGGLLFSSWAAPRMDESVKEFRLFADFINNVGLFLDMMAPYCPTEYFLMITAAASLCKTACGIAAGATKGSVTQHFSISGNMADVATKENAQETLVSLVGMIVGLGIARYLQLLQEEEDEHPEIDYDITVEHVQWFLFVVLTVMHMWANTKAVQGLRLRTLNAARAERVLATLIKTTLFDMLMSALFLQPDSLVPVMRTTLLRPVDVLEPLFARRNRRIASVTLSQLLLLAAMKDLQVLQDFQEEPYVLAVGPRNRVLVALLQGCPPRGELQAYLHALLTLAVLDRLGRDAVTNMTPESRRQTVRQTLAQTKRLFLQDDKVNVWSELQGKGWNLERVYLGFGSARSQWMADEKTD